MHISYLYAYEISDICEYMGTIENKKYREYTDG